MNELRFQAFRTVIKFVFVFFYKKIFKRLFVFCRQKKQEKKILIDFSFLAQNITRKAA